MVWGGDICNTFNHKGKFKKYEKQTNKSTDLYPHPAASLDSILCDVSGVECFHVEENSRSCDKQSKRCKTDSGGPL